MVININVSNKRAEVIGAPVIVCGNADYTVKFTFDAEWNEYSTKTARFVYIRGGAVEHQDVIFSGDTVAVPALFDTREALIGVYAENPKCTSTPVCVPCELSVCCGVD